MCSVEVQLELGHKASPRLKPTDEGYTHDWTVFVKGADSCNIKYFVEKVIFQLHDSFPKPRRVVKEPPYQVSESGYAGFELPIEVYFRNKEEPKKITFEYDLYLRVNEICNNSRREKLTFQNPNNDFKKKLLKAGGVINDKSMVTSTTSSNNEDKHNHSSSKAAKSHHDRTNETRKSSKMISVIPSKDKSLQNQQVSASTSSSLSSHSHSTSDKNTSSQSQSQSQSQITTSLQSQFTDLFGTPIQARPSPDSSKFKDNFQKHKSCPNDNASLVNNKKPFHVKENTKKKDCLDKVSDKEKKHKPSSSSNKEVNLLKDKVKSKKSSDNVKTTKDKTSNKPQASLQSSLFSEPDKTLDGKVPNKKRKRSDSNASSLFTNTSSSYEKKEKKLFSSNSSSKNSDKLSKKESKKQRTSKDVIASSASGASNVNHKLKDVKKESSTSTTISFSNNNNTGTTTLEIKSVKKEKTWDSEVKKSRNKEHKSNEVKPLKENVSKEVNKLQAKEDNKSLKDSSNVKYNKVPNKEKGSTPISLRGMSSSPASVISGSLTPGGSNYINAPSSASSVNGPISTMIAEMDQESLPVSPLSSCDLDSPSLAFGSVKSKTKLLIDSDDDSKTFKNSKEVQQKSKRSERSENEATQLIKESNSDINNRNRKELSKSSKSMSSSKMEHVQDTQDLSNKLNEDAQYIKELIVLKKKISELRDSDLLQNIVDIIEETGMFNLTNTSIDFDLMKLDKYTVKRIKTCLIPT